MAEGIRKINEYVLQPGRSLVITDDRLKVENIPDGSIFVDPASGDLRYKQKLATEYIRFTPDNLFDLKTISKNLLVDKTLTDLQIQDGGITNECLKDKTINTDKIKDGAISSKLIAIENVLTDHLIDGCVTEPKLAEGAVSERALKDGSVTDIKLGVGAVHGDNILEGGITGDKIALHTITNSNLSDECVDGRTIKAGALTDIHLKDGSVTTPKLAEGAVTTTKIKAGNVTAICLGTSSVTTEKLALSAVTTERIKDGAINNAKIALGTIENSRIRLATIALDRLTTTVQKAINSAIKLGDNGIATVNGTLNVTGNVNVKGDITARRVHNAVYNDLAEGYIPGEKLSPGDIVEIREDGKVYKCRAISSTVVGVVSNEYAQCFGASVEELASGQKVAVGLIGKVHTFVDGPVKQGDYIVTYDNGVGSASKTKINGTVGRALESSDSYGIHKVLCLIFPS